MGKMKNLEGKKFGRLSVYDKYEIRRNNNKTKVYWFCHCDCGNKKWIRGSSLLSGDSLSCGCLVREKNSVLLKNRMLEKGVKNLCGMRLGRLEVLSSYKRVQSGNGFITKWLCRCDCGNEKWIQTSSLRNKITPTKSCGCLARENASRSNRKSIGEAALNAVYSYYRSRAKKKMISFQLSKEEFGIICKKKCFYCGSDGSNHMRRPSMNGDLYYNGVDRVDNLLGYEIDNCVPCCSTCNRAKDIMSKEDFLNWVKKVYSNICCNERI